MLGGVGCSLFMVGVLVGRFCYIVMLLKIRIDRMKLKIGFVVMVVMCV